MSRKGEGNCEPSQTKRQLPPVDTDDANSLLDNPHVFLDQIMRQAADNEIIKLSMDIREMKPFGNYDGNNVKIYEKADLSTGMMLWADQILVGTNKTRFEMNAKMRQLLNKGPLPEDGDKVICVRNYWEDYSMTGDPLVNGTIGILRSPIEGRIDIPHWIKTDKHYFDVIDGEIETGDCIYPAVTVDKNMLLKEEKCCDWRVAYALNKAKPRIGDLLPREFVYGYAITTHKAQGSEWDKVLVIEERFPFDKLEHARWLYTAVTRSSDKLVLVRG